MSKPGVPAYGKSYRLEHLAYDSKPGHLLTNRRYVLKADETWWIRSSVGSKQWWVFGPIARGSHIRGYLLPSGSTHGSHHGVLFYAGTMREAMEWVRLERLRRDAEYELRPMGTL